MSGSTFGVFGFIVPDLVVAGSIGFIVPELVDVDLVDLFGWFGGLQKAKPAPFSVLFSF